MNETINKPNHTSNAEKFLIFVEPFIFGCFFKIFCIFLKYSKFHKSNISFTPTVRTIT